MPIKVELLLGSRTRLGAKTLKVTPDRWTVTGLVEALLRDHPELRDALLEENGEVSYRYTLLVNDRPVGRGSWDETPLVDRDKVMLLTMVSGG
ncbi:MAG: MoaD/ThiS family protein [Pseudomonadota bacterium]